MKDWSRELRDYLAGNNEIAYCLKLALVSGRTYYFTDRDHDITVGGHTWLYSPGFFTSDIQTTSKSSTDNLDLVGAYADFKEYGITRDILTARELEGATFELYICAVTDLTIPLGLLQSGEVGRITIKDNDYSIELRSLSQRLQQDEGDLYSPTCRVRKFGYGQCGHDLVVADYTESGTVATVTSNKVFTITDITAPARVLVNDWYSYGAVVWLTGENAGLEHKIRDHGYSGGIHTIELDYPTPYDIVVGDAFNIIAGCDRSTTACKKFGNIVNFQGEPYVVGDKSKEYADPRDLMP
jgi:uncharacterized phage protein (TIGR02218 family)